MMRVFSHYKPLIKYCLPCMVLLCGCAGSSKSGSTAGRQEGITAVKQKPVIYQVLVRLFGNRNLTDQYYGAVEQNGVGKFADITGRALDSIKALGVSYIWYTGVLEHATMTDYTKYGIAPDDPDVVKGRAGSPYAVKDYYDVDPDLATDVTPAGFLSE